MKTRFLLFGCFAALLTFSLMQTEALSQGESILERFERRSRTNDLEGVAEPFKGITRDGSVEDGLFSIQSTGVSTEPIRLAAEAFLEAANDAFDGRDARVSDDEARGALEEVSAQQAVAAAAEGAVQAEAGNAFRAENGEREEVTTLPSGLQYEVLNMGDGDKPASTSSVTTHYHGTLIDGTVFDSSVERGTPASFPLDRVIPGWTEALQLMPVGSKWRLVLPPDLAYGERGSPPTIQPNATLVFDVELLSIESPDVE